MHAARSHSQYTVLHVMSNLLAMMVIDPLLHALQHQNHLQL